MQKYSQRGGGMSGARAPAPCVMGPPLGVREALVVAGAKSIVWPWAPSRSLWSWMPCQ
jgi:hypothetical protein